MAQIVAEEREVSERSGDLQESDRQGEQGKQDQRNGDGRSCLRAGLGPLLAEEHQKDHSKTVETRQHGADDSADPKPVIAERRRPCRPENPVLAVETGRDERDTRQSGCSDEKGPEGQRQAPS